MRAVWVTDAVYDAGERFVSEVLRSDGSLFTPGSVVWSTSTVDDFYTRFVTNADYGSGTFMQKLEQQLDGASDVTIQLAAEAIYFNYLCEVDTGPDHKRKIVRQVLDWMKNPVGLPDELGAAYPHGIARIGLAKTQKWQQIAFLLEFVREWKRLSDSDSQDALSSSERFRDFVHSIPKHSASIQVEGLLHLVFPDDYEPVVSPNVKKKITEAFADYLDGTEANVDEKLRTIRSRISEDYGPSFSFYDEDLTAVWGEGTAGDTPAWLVRGAKAYGSDLIPRWLEDAFVSIGRDDEGHVLPGQSFDEILDTLAAHIPEKTREQLRNGALSTMRFVSKMAPGDFILTIDSNDAVYVGRVTGELEWIEGDAPGTARRRSVAWLNRETPARREDLPERLKRLLRQNTVIDLSAVSADVAALIPTEERRQWEEFAQWAARIFETEGFDAEERDYKLEIAERLAAVRAAVAANDPEWVDWLRKAFGPPSNLTSWRAHGEFLDAVAADPARGRAFLDGFWKREPDVVSFDGLLDRWPAENPAGSRISIASFLLLAVDPTRWPIFRARAISKAYDLAGFPEPEHESLAKRYWSFVGFLDDLIVELGEMGVVLRDRLDAQGLVWWVAQNDPPESWSAEERARFLAWRGDGEVVPTNELEALAQELTMDVAELLKVIRLLERRQQIVFYGPPGTGKTYVAQKLAAYVAGSSDRVRLVQFHASYAYEDFVEGYRPSVVEGAPGFRLSAGPLKRLAEAARSAPAERFVLVIDELNRGNVAKVFGELYFLLEYRRASLELQYSEQPFSLPPNLLLIGTMNTADRTIALLDAALRRRFFFVPFFPGRPPVGDLLRTWLGNHKPDLLWIADAVDRANEELGDQHLAIGHSFFIDPELTEERAVDTWEHAILPTIEEHFFGQPERVLPFRLASLRAHSSDIEDEEEAEGDLSNGSPP